MRVPNPIAYAVGAYQLAEMSERFWGPRLFDYYGEGYPDPLTLEAIEGGGIPRSSMKPTKAKRKVSKANKATKQAYNWLQKKVKGKMTQKKCCDLLKKAAKMASKANPNTPSRIGKGRKGMKGECRKIRKRVWNTTRRY